MPITPLPTPAPARTQTQAAFDAAYAAHIAALPAFITQANLLADLLNATSGAGAITIPYTFSTTTTDSDPGAGILRLNQATQNTATVIRADLLGSDALDKTALLTLVGASSSTVKGYIRLVHATDANKYLVFEVTALASPAGYRNITVVLVASSAASPFANSDSIVLYFTRTGDTPLAVGDHAVVVHTGNASGSTNTAIMRYTTAMTNVGTAITYADSATLGATFTINDTGMYSIMMQQTSNLVNGAFGVSRNSAQLTTDVVSINQADRLLLARAGDTNDIFNLSIVERLIAGDVIRPHGSVTYTAHNQATSRLSIRKVGL